MEKFDGITIGIPTRHLDVSFGGRNRADYRSKVDTLGDRRGDDWAGSWGTISPVANELKGATVWNS